MSRIPQRSPLKKPQPPSSPLSPSSNVKSREKTLSTPSTPSPALRAQKSQTTLKPPKSPSRLRKNSREEEEFSEKQKPNLSIKEQIALKRAEIKKSAPIGLSRGPDPGFEGLEDADPGAINKTDEEDPNDLGRWSVRETIERARTTGRFYIQHALIYAVFSRRAT